MGLFSAIGSLFGLGGNRKALQTAANQANAGLQNGINNIQGQQTNNNNLFSPTETAGNQATQSLAQLLGLGTPNGAANAISEFANSPNFQALNNIGINTVLQNESATGGLRGGDANNALFNESTNLLNNLYQQQVGNLGSLSALGLNASSNNAQLNSGLSGSIAQMLGMQGQNSANATLGKQAATNSVIGQFGNFLDATSSSGSTNGSNIFNAIASLF